MTNVDYARSGAGMNSPWNTAIASYIQDGGDLRVSGRLAHHVLLAAIENHFDSATQESIGNRMSVDDDSII